MCPRKGHTTIHREEKILHHSMDLRIQTIGVSIENNIDTTAASSSNHRMLETKVDTNNAHIALD
jgi:hypothetical protein